MATAPALMTMEQCLHPSLHPDAHIVDRQHSPCWQATKQWEFRVSG